MNFTDMIDKVYIHLNFKQNSNVIAIVNIVFTNGIEIKQAMIKKGKDGQPFFQLPYRLMHGDILTVHNEDNLKTLSEMCLREFKKTADSINFIY